MNYVKKELPSYNLHMIKTDKFKSVSIEIIISREIKKEEITISSFLSSILAYSTKKYNSKIKLARKMENLYAADFGSFCFRLGKTYNFDFSIRVLDDKYTEKGLFEEAVDFINEVLFNPNVEKNAFDLTSFNVIKHKAESRIERFRESPGRYSVLKAFELYDENAPYSYNMTGYLDDLNKITPENLYEYYKEFIKSNSIDIYVVGDIDFDYIENIFLNKLKFNNKLDNSIDVIIESKKHRKKIQEDFENDNTNQSKLSIVCSIENMSDFEKKYVLDLYDIILGGYADSKFFKNIREKHSLCYYASSETNKADNTMLITSGINKENYKKMISLIKKEMKDMVTGNFSSEDLDKAKSYYISSIDEIEDRPAAIIATCNYVNKLKTDMPDKVRDKVIKVTKEDIQKLASKVYIDTVFLLGGDKK